MIIVIGGIKGGSGKTTLATNLSVIAAENGDRILLVDADPQSSTEDWSLIRQETPQAEVLNVVKADASNIRDVVQENVSRYKHVFVDVGGKDGTAQRAVLTIADIALIPFTPGVYDVWALEQAGSIIPAVKVINPYIRIYGVLNQADTQGRENSDALGVAGTIPGLQLIQTIIHKRKAFRMSAGEGQSVTEWRNKKRENDKKAIAEMRGLYTELVLGAK